MSKDCPVPAVCKECGSEDHMVKDCPNKICKNCGEKGKYPSLYSSLSGERGS